MRMVAALALTKLGWRPETDKERVDYAIALDRWEDAASVGAMAVEPLLNELRIPRKNGKWVTPDFALGADKPIIPLLGRMRDPRAVDPLIALLGSPMHGLFNSQKGPYLKMVAQVLASIGEPAVQPLMAALRQGGSNVPDIDSAAAVLAVCGPSGLTALAQLLRESVEGRQRWAETDDPSVRDTYDHAARLFNAARSELVGARGAAYPVLRPLLNDKNHSVREAAAFLWHLINNLRLGLPIDHGGAPPAWLR